MLDEFIEVNRGEIITRCRAKVATRSAPPPTDAEIDHGVPVFLDQLQNALRLGETTSPEINRSAVKHGHDLLLQGFTVSHTAIMAFEVLKTGNVGVGGSTGAVLHRSLVASSALIGRSLAEVRLTQGVQNREQFLVAGFIEEIASASTLDANARGVRLSVMSIEDGLAIEADRQVLAAVVGNLLQNAFKFTRPRTTVTLRVGANAERVLIEVEDECGGLSSADVNELFRPFEQRSADRSGMGLGLAFSRWGAEANNGRIYGRTLEGRGCVFTVDLPRHPVPAVEVVRC